jgi:hypothetical protein
MTEWGESLTATCFTLMPKEILAQSADATETEASGWNPATMGSREFILSRLDRSWSMVSFPPLEPTNFSSTPSRDASCSTSR